jgi:hypothetical protein
MVWPLWAAAGIAAIGGVLPFVFGGGSSRVVGVIVPFLAGAIALALCGLLYSQGRTVTYTLYFVAGLAIVFGLLSMISVPVRLAALGACPALPAPCPSGLPRPLTDGENTGIGAASAFGIVAILLGFYGLVAVVRRPAIASSAPPVRMIPPVPAPKPAEPEPVQRAVVESAKEQEPELAAHEEQELPELPPHESTTPTT